MRHMLKLLIISTFFWQGILAQVSWEYKPTANITFATADSLNNPFLCATDASGNLWVLSSTSTSTHAINALYKAAPGSQVFQLVDDYTSIADIHSGRGITTIGNDVYVAFRKTQTDLAAMIRYPEGDVNRRETFSLTSYISGYGTYVYGIAGTSDNYIYGGIVYQGPRIRLYDFTGTATPNGKYVAPECTAVDPGGPSATGQDAIRDVATIPGGNYFDPNTPVYTSRNSLPDGNTGGVTKWTGGVQNNPSSYTCVAVEDADSYLKWTSYVPNGITCDSEGNLWAVGTDTTRRWVKCFQIEGNWATQISELPSSTSPDSPDPNGAPFVTPEDIALSPDGNTAYVIDCGAHQCFVFQKKATGVKPGEPNLAASFRLFPAHPNPFNPVTKITYELPATTPLRVAIFNLQGKCVATLFQGTQTAGQHQLQFDASGLESGIYFCKLSTSAGEKTTKLVLLK